MHTAPRLSCTASALRPVCQAASPATPPLTPPLLPAAPPIQVGQALQLAAPPPLTWPSPAPHPGGNSTGTAQLSVLSAEIAAQQLQQRQHMGIAQHMAEAQRGAGGLPSLPGGRGAAAARVYVCTKDDSLRTVVERLSIPGVRRLIIVHPETRRVDGLISLSDVAGYLFL